MKKITLFTIVFVSAILFSNKVSAQDNSAFEKGTVVATVGYGFPDFYRANLRTSYSSYRGISVTGFGPMIIKGDYGIMKFKWGHSVGAGIVLGYSSSKVQYTDYYNQATVTVVNDYYRTITIGARGSYHFFTKEKIDCYASIGAGFNINSYSSPYSGYGRSAVSRSVLYEAFTVGIRYYFTKNIGVYAEGGWDMSSIIQGGVAIKF